eukprot:g3364.t1
MPKKCFGATLVRKHYISQAAFDKYVLKSSFTKRIDLSGEEALYMSRTIPSQSNSNAAEQSEEKRCLLSIVFRSTLWELSIGREQAEMHRKDLDDSWGIEFTTDIDFASAFSSALQNPKLKNFVGNESTLSLILEYNIGGCEVIEPTLSLQYVCKDIHSNVVEILHSIFEKNDSAPSKHRQQQLNENKIQEKTIVSLAMGKGGIEMDGSSSNEEKKLPLKNKKRKNKSRIHSRRIRQRGTANKIKIPPALLATERNDKDAK